MKNPILCLAASLVLLCSCQKDRETLVEKTSDLSANTTTSGFTRYTITKGEHYASNNAYKAIETNELTFVVRFDSTAAYQSVKAENQYDINKLYGFSDNNACTIAIVPALAGAGTKAPYACLVMYIMRVK